MISEPQTPGGKPLFSRPLLLLGAVLAGVLILALVEVLAHGGPVSAAAPPATHPAVTRPPGRAVTTSPAPAPAVSPGGSTASCHVPPGNQDVPTSAPSGVTWRLYQAIALPFSVQAGPTVIDGDVARCYAHSPTGALLALAQIFVRTTVAPDWRAVLDEQVIPGAGRSVFAAERPGEDIPVQPGENGQIDGFQFVTYSSATAVIQMVLQMPDGSLRVAVMTVTWSDEDWRLELQPDGQMSPNVQQASSLAGFIPWEGV